MTLLHGSNASRRKGFSLVEITIAVVLLAIVVAKLTIVIEEARESHQRESETMALEDRALQVLDRIALAIMGSDRETLFPETESPTFTPSLEYRVSMGVEDGEVVWGDPEIIALSDDSTSVFWAQNFGEANERMVVWCNDVSRLLEEEIENGADDNDNELPDETGLNFVLDRDSVTIRLTLEGEDREGDPIRHTVSTTVTCRN